MKKFFILLFSILTLAGQAGATTRHQLSFRQLVALGQITGASIVFKFGSNPSLDIGTPEDCFGNGGDYPFPSTATTISAVSSDADDNGTGTGARTITFYGLDSNFDKIQETVTLTGLTPVLTTQLFYRVFRAIVEEVGSSSYNEGNITGTVDGGAVIFVSTTEGQSTVGVYTVPRNHDLLIDTFFSGLTKKQATSGDAHFEIRLFGKSWNLKQTLGLSNSAPFERNAKVPFVIPEKTDIRVRIHDITTNGTGAVCSFDGILIDKAKFTGY